MVAGEICAAVLLHAVLDAGRAALVRAALDAGPVAQNALAALRRMQLCVMPV